MDLLTIQENSIKSLLESIDGTLQPSGYTYYTTTGMVNINDVILAQDLSDNPNEVLYSIYQTEEGEVAEDTDIGFNAYTCNLTYRIEANVTNTGDESQPNFAINQRMNEVLADLKALFGVNNTLNGSAFSAFYNKSERKYATNNNIIRTATLYFYLDVRYSQNLNNPDIIACDA